MIKQDLLYPACTKSCPRILELEEKIENLKKDNAIKEERIRRMWNELRKYKNPHTPPSRRLGSSNSKSKGGKSANGKPGQKEGHEGKTRSWPEPSETIIVSEERCTKCGSKLGEPIETDTRIIEDIPDPQQVKATEYKVHRYRCHNCEEEVIASHENLPPEGRLGYNVVVQTTLFKYHARSVQGRRGTSLSGSTGSNSHRRQSST